MKDISSTANQCGLCAQGCLTCLDGGRSNCLTCLSSLTLVGNAPAACTCQGYMIYDGRQCSCPIRHFSSGANQCDLCARGYLNCLDGGSDSYLTCMRSLKLAGTAPAACLCEDEDAGCCDNTCDGSGYLPLCESCNSDSLSDAGLAFAALLPILFAFSESGIVTFIVAFPIIWVVAFIIDYFKRDQE